MQQDRRCRGMVGYTRLLPRRDPRAVFRDGLDGAAEPAPANTAGESVFKLLDAFAVAAPQGDHGRLTLM
jgi:hypothetical protein